MTNYEWIIEVCHDLMNRAMRCESDPSCDLQNAFDDRAKERAIRRLMADADDARRLLAKVVRGGNPTGPEWQRINELTREVDR